MVEIREATPEDLEEFKKQRRHSWTELEAKIQEGKPFVVEGLTRSQVYAIQRKFRDIAEVKSRKSGDHYKVLITPKEGE